MSSPSKDELHADVVRARSELAQTLAAIEDKVNVPRKVKRAASRTGDRVRTLARENPVLLGAVALVGAVVVGAAVWTLVRAVSKD